MKKLFLEETIPLQWRGAFLGGARAERQDEHLGNKTAQERRIRKEKGDLEYKLDKRIPQANSIITGVRTRNPAGLGCQRRGTSAQARENQII